jgi:selenium metabolism protein YedF
MSMPVTINARGLPCPQPVILTRNAMREANEVVTLVSQRDQVDNVSRLAERAGWRVTFEQANDGWAIHMVQGPETAEPELTPDLTTCEPTAAPRLRVVLLSSDQLGRGEPELGAILMRSFLYTLGEIEPRPQTLILLNAGVKLAVEGSPVLQDLRALEESGLQLLVCGTCLDYYQLKERLAVGSISNMYTIAETLMGADQTTLF